MVSNIVYVIAVFGIGLLGLRLMSRTKSKTTRKIILVPCMIAMMVLMCLWQNIF
jgi:membrane protein CcdC involved in cytochrome C biogenesis